MNLSIFKFLLKKGLAFPRNEEELDYVKENIINKNEDVDTPTFEETWNYISKRQSKEYLEPLFRESSSNSSGMSQAARFGGKISEEVRQQMEKDKDEARRKTNNNDNPEKRKKDN